MATQEDIRIAGSDAEHARKELAQLAAEYHEANRRRLGDFSGAPLPPGLTFRDAELVRGYLRALETLKLISHADSDAWYEFATGQRDTKPGDMP